MANMTGTMLFQVLHDAASRGVHNKPFIADNQVTIVSGLNIGDEYFGATNDVMFADLDVIAIGAVVNYDLASGRSLRQDRP